MGALGILKNVFMGLVVLFLLLELPVLIVFVSLYTSVLDPVTYKAALERGKFYDNAGAALSAMVANGSRMPVDVSSLFSRDWIKKQMESVIDQAFDYVNGKTESPAVFISLAELKAGAAEQIPFFANFSSQIPDRLDVAAQANLSPLLAQARQFVSFAQMALAALGGVALLCVGVLFALAGKLKSRLRWIGFPLAFSGFFVLLVAFLGGAQASALIPAVGGGPAAAVFPVASALVKIILERVYLVAGVFFLVGSAMLAASFTVKEATALPEAVPAVKSRK